MNKGILALALAAAIPATAMASGHSPSRDGNWFDWDRYHTRKDVCREKDRLALQCALVGPDQRQIYCDELASRQAQRACSAFGSALSGCQ